MSTLENVPLPSDELTVVCPLCFKGPMHSVQLSGGLVAVEPCGCSIFASVQTIYLTETGVFVWSPDPVTVSKPKRGHWGGGCPVQEWDGPYNFTCGLGGNRGTCAYHGEFATEPGHG